MCGKSQLLPTAHGFLAFLASPPQSRFFIATDTGTGDLSPRTRVGAPPFWWWIRLARRVIFGDQKVTFIGG
jgi:hypothetical protein